MDLATYISAIGDEEAARRFGVKVRTAASWRRGERLPRPKKAREIESESNGRVSVNDIYRATPAG